MKNTIPDESKLFTSTIRVDGRPSGPTVASVIAFGSGTFAFRAASNHFSNSPSGSFPAAPSSSESRS